MKQQLSACPMGIFRSSSLVSRLSLLIACAGSVAMLSGCASSGAGKLAAKISDECGKLARYVEPPDVDETTDYRPLAGEALADLNTANRRMNSYDRCVKNIIREYADAK